jgi:hypothetical protein
MQQTLTIYEMSLYGTLYHQEADSELEAKRKLLESFSPKHPNWAKIPLSHIHVVREIK